MSGGFTQKRKRVLPLIPEPQKPLLRRERRKRKKEGKLKQREPRLKKGKNTEQNTNGIVNT